MPTTTFPFTSGRSAATGWGNRAKARFVGTWANGDTWVVPISAVLSGPQTVGKGNISGQDYVSTFKLGNRMYVGFDGKFALSAVGDPTKWEEQNPGAGVISFTSQFGQQDEVQAFASMQGRLAVFGRFSTQIWEVNANPALFAIQQALDQTGTIAPASVKSIGDLDVYYLDRTGVRSLKAKESTLNAFVEDVGTPIDSLVRELLAPFGEVYEDVNVACAVVEPSTKQYWIYIATTDGFTTGTVFVLSRFPASKILAWSTFGLTVQETVAPNSPTYSAGGTVTYTTITDTLYYWTKGSGETQLVNGTETLTSSGAFTAQGSSVTVTGVALAAVTGTLQAQTAIIGGIRQFITHQGRVYAFANDLKVYLYGGTDNATYDHCPAIAELPWLDFKTPSDKKQLTGLDTAMTGHWKIETGTDPTQTSFNTAIDRGSQTAPSMVNDSTFDKGRFAARGCGTHIKIKATTYTDAAAKLGKINIVYNKANKK